MPPRFESPPPTSVNRAPLFVTYGRMRLTGYFRHSLPDYTGGMKVVVQSDRGVEMGEVNVNHCAVCPAGGSCSKPRNVGRRTGEGSPVGRVLRAATDNDVADSNRLADGDRRIRDRVREIVAGKSMPMRVVEAERLLGGDRLVVYFASENRVDFRELVRELAREFQTRVEMRQIGSRDEAKLLGEGYGRCGEPLCCQTFLQDLRNVPMRMAKTQKATLDPSKVSGRCGRLMCCLRYEDATYEELKRRLPGRGSRVATPDGPATVLDVQILTQLVMVELDGRGGRAAFGAEELTVLEEARRYDRESESSEDESESDRPHSDRIDSDDDREIADRRSSDESRVRSGDESRVRRGDESRVRSDLRPRQPVRAPRELEPPMGSDAAESGSDETAGREERPTREPRAGGRSRSRRGPPRPLRDEAEPQSGQLGSDLAEPSSPSSESESLPPQPEPDKGAPPSVEARP